MLENSVSANTAMKNVNIVGIMYLSLAVALTELQRTSSSVVTAAEREKTHTRQRADVHTAAQQDE